MARPTGADRESCYELGDCPYVGGNYGNAGSAGLFCFNLNNNPTNNNSNIGGRLAKGITPEAQSLRGLRQSVHFGGRLPPWPAEPGKQQNRSCGK